MRCRHCSAELALSFMDLGSAPPSNAYLTEQALSMPERWYPLRVLVCQSCWLVQTEDYAHYSELFSSDYAYFSSFSSTWLQHAEHYVTTMAERFHLDDRSRVVEVASNDGYLLQYVKARGIPCLGVEPTESTASAAREKGIEVVSDFFGTALAEHLRDRGLSSDLMVANNVLAHVQDINDFVSGFRVLLKPDGVVTFEFPHLLKLVEMNQFDTIYHEHYSYFSFTSVARILAKNGLSIFDVEELPVHGGSLRVYAQRMDSGTYIEAGTVGDLLARENGAGIQTRDFYMNFQARAERVKNDFLAFLLNTKSAGATVGAYGAAAKGNTLINFCGIKRDLIPWIVDASPHKRGKYLPGSRIPIVDESVIRREAPAYVLVLPWNLENEIRNQLHYISEWGGRFVTAIPHLQISSAS